MWEIFIICQKMLFRRSIRYRLIWLIVGFLSIIGFNIYQHFEKINTINKKTVELLNNDAFKFFFIFSLEKKDYYALNKKLSNSFPDHITVLSDIFIYKKNLYLDLIPIKENTKRQKALHHMYSMFSIKDYVNQFYSIDSGNKRDAFIHKSYIDYNGKMIATERLEKRKGKMNDTIRFFTDTLSEKLGREQKAALAKKQSVFFDSIRIQHKGNINPFLSKIEMIIPFNIFYILGNISNQPLNIISNALTPISEDQYKIKKKYVHVLPENEYLYKMAFDSLRPKYSAIFIKHFIYRNTDYINTFFLPTLSYKNDIMNFLRELQFKGNYLFSFEKLHVIKHNVDTINSEITHAQLSFSIIDFFMSLIFSFMMSFFSFIYLKKEISFILFYKNRIRQIIHIFYISPILLILIIKLLLYLYFFKFVFVNHVVFSLISSYIIVITLFWFINQWCFKEFISDQLNLYSIYKGK